jgi:hypothetical protein
VRSARWRMSQPLLIPTRVLLCLVRAVAGTVPRGWYSAAPVSPRLSLQEYMELMTLPNFGSDPYRHTANLNDVASGTNGRCTVSYLCTAVAGYDGPTGLGTPKGVTAFGF